MDTMHTPATRPVNPISETIDNLGRLSAVRADLTAAEALDFSAYFVGYLAPWVPTDVWERALNESCLHIARRRDQRAQRAQGQAVAS